MGDTLAQLPLNDEPQQLKLFQDTSGTVRVAIVLGRCTVHVANLQNDKNSMDLAFKAKYGDIKAIDWLRPDAIVAGFSTGTMVSLAVGTCEYQSDIERLKFRF